MQVLGSISIPRPCCSCFSPQLGDAKELSSLVGVLMEEEELFIRGVEVDNILWEERPDMEVVTPAAEAAPESESLFNSVLFPWRLEDWPTLTLGVEEVVVERG